ncbi:MAG TPA: protein translocase subunit SecD [Acidimicrobiia bacterium]|nr:protein translocase subunit SecD [Acidimicrobiia bacterium]
MRRNAWFLVVTLVVVFGSFTAVIVTGTTPVLGLDLQGGISVTLNPEGNPSSGAIDKAKDIIASRVDGLGVAEPEISRQGDTIVVDLPGVKDRDKALNLIGQTAELRFRPVLAVLPPFDPAATTTTSTVAPGDTIAPDASSTTTTLPPSDGSDIPTTSRDDDVADAVVVLPGRDTGDGPPQRYQLGPTELTGKAVSGARASFQNGEWVVNVDFTSEGSSEWDRLGQENFQKQVAIVLDGVVQSAPVIQGQNQTFESFEGSAQISGDFGESEAKDLALVLRYGALPIRFDPNDQKVQSVSPTLGKDQLRAGIASGIIGLVLVAIYMLVYYRLLGAVVIAGLVVAGAAIYALVAMLGQTISLTLTLAGVTGLIVSVGITVDSYVVYFERLKDEVRTGKTVRSSVDRGFVRSWRTILAADLVSIIGAATLYWLAIGSVRGFAFFLGVSTVLDLFISYFFMHPLVSILARRRALVRTPFVGMEAGLDMKAMSEATP